MLQEARRAARSTKHFLTEILHQNKQLQRQHTNPCTSQLCHLPTCCHSLFFPPAASGMPSCGSQVGTLWLCCTRPDWGLAAVTPTEKTKNFQLLRQPLRLEEQVLPASALEAEECHPRNFTSESFSLWLLLGFRPSSRKSKQGCSFPCCFCF